MKTFFEPKINGLDDVFSNLTGKSLTTATANPISAAVSSLPAMPKVTSTSYIPKSTTSVSLPSMPKVTSSTYTPSSTVTNTTSPSSQPSQTIISPPIANPISTDGSYVGGGGMMQSGTAEESLITNDGKLNQKTTESRSDMLFGIKKSYIFGGAFLVLAGFVYLKYIKK